MRILHTADWHLGKKLDFVSRIEEQVNVMEEICQIADNQNVDLVIVAGDLFDAFNPPTEAVELLYKTLKRLTNNGRRPVIAIAGNHDSPSLIDAPDPLARECGIIMIGYPNSEVKFIKLHDFEIINSTSGLVEIKLNHLDYPVRILHTPYANEVRLAEYLGEENKEEALNEVLHRNWLKLADKYCDDKGINLLTAHLYMMKRGSEVLEEPEGEKPIRVGNADLIYSEIIPKQIQYTALGHLHGYRNVGTENHPAVYSSSPLCYSFSEAGQQKYVAIVTLEPGQKAVIDKITLNAGKPLSRKHFKDVDAAVDWLDKNRNHLVELTMETETFLTTDERKRLSHAHSGIIRLIPKVSNPDLTTKELKEVNLNENIDVLFVEYFKSKNEGQQPNDDLMNLLKEIL